MSAAKSPRPGSRARLKGVDAATTKPEKACSVPASESPSPNVSLPGSLVLEGILPTDLILRVPSDGSSSGRSSLTPPATPKAENVASSEVVKRTSTKKGARGRKTASRKRKPKGTARAVKSTPPPPSNRSSQSSALDTPQMPKRKGLALLPTVKPLVGLDSSSQEEDFPDDAEATTAIAEEVQPIAPTAAVESVAIPPPTSAALQGGATSPSSATTSALSPTGGCSSPSGTMGPPKSPPSRHSGGSDIDIRLANVAATGDRPKRARRITIKKGSIKSAEAPSLRSERSGDLEGAPVSTEEPAVPRKPSVWGGSQHLAAAEAKHKAPVKKLKSRQKQTTNNKLESLLERKVTLRKESLVQTGKLRADSRVKILSDIAGAKEERKNHIQLLTLDDVALESWHKAHGVVYADEPEECDAAAGPAWVPPIVVEADEEAAHSDNEAPPAPPPPPAVKRRPSALDKLAHAIFGAPEAPQADADAAPMGRLRSLLAAVGTKRTSQKKRLSVKKRDSKRGSAKLLAIIRGKQKPEDEVDAEEPDEPKDQTTDTDPAARPGAATQQVQTQRDAINAKPGLTSEERAQAKQRLYGNISRQHREANQQKEQHVGRHPFSRHRLQGDHVRNKLRKARKRAQPTIPAPFVLKGEKLHMRALAKKSYQPTPKETAKEKRWTRMKLSIQVLQDYEGEVKTDVFIKYVPCLLDDETDPRYLPRKELDRLLKLQEQARRHQEALAGPPPEYVPPLATVRASPNAFYSYEEGVRRFVMPSELLVRILAFADVRTCCQAALVCRQWNVQAEAERLWLDRHAQELASQYEQLNEKLLGLPVEERLDLEVRVFEPIFPRRWKDAVRMTRQHSYLRPVEVEYNPIVIDNGGSHFRAGLAQGADGGDQPSVVVPAVLAFPKGDHVRANLPHVPLTRDASRVISLAKFPAFLIGEEVDPGDPLCQLRYDIRDQPFCNQPRSWEDVGSVYAYLFDSMGLDPSEHPVLVSQPWAAPKTMRPALLEMLFETFSVRAAYVEFAPLLAAYSYGAFDGLVVDIGSTSTQLVPVMGGMCLEHHAMRLFHLGTSRANSSLVDWLSLPPAELVHDLHLMGLTPPPEVFTQHPALQEHHHTLPYYTTSLSSILARRLARVVPNLTAHVLASANLVPCPILHQERMVAGDLLGAMCGEVFMNPRRMLGDEEASLLSLPEAVEKVVSQCPIDTRAALLDNILLCGGGSMIKGLPQRLEADLRPLVSVAPRVRADVDRDSATWRGGSVLSRIDAFQDLWLQQDDYKEQGMEKLLANHDHDRWG